MLTKVCGVVMPGAGEANALQVGHHRVGVPLVDAATVRQYVSLETNNTVQLQLQPPACFY